MKKMQQLVLLLVSCLFFLSAAHAGTNTGTVARISVLENRDVIVTTSEHAGQPACATNHDMILRHDDPAYQETYGALLIAALQEADVTIQGTGTCLAGGKEEIISNFSFVVNPEDKLSSHTILNRTLSEKAAQTPELNAFLEELLDTFGAGDDTRSYSGITTPQADCLLNALRHDLAESGYFQDIVVPSTYTGHVTFRMKGIPTAKFDLYYDYNVKTTILFGQIVKKPYFVSAQDIWDMMEDGMKQCVKNAKDLRQ